MAHPDLSQFDTLLFDCDGVLWRGNTVIPGAAETVAKLRAQGKRVYFVTNNSSKSRRQYLPIMEKHGFSGVTIDEVVSSSSLVAPYFASVQFSGAIFAISSGGIVDELAQAGFSVRTDSSAGCAAVAVGYDDTFSYQKLAQATLAIQRGALFVATNMDATYPSAGGEILPGAGSIVASIMFATSRRPVVLGKPESFMIEAIRLRQPSFQQSRALMIGDRLDTDIAFGHAHGMRTVLVLTGVTTQDMLSPSAAGGSSGPQPDFVLPTVAELGRPGVVA